MTTPHLHMTVSGGGPPVVLLHGFLASNQYWHECIRLLSENFTVYAPDLLGFGDSPKPRRARYDYAQHLEALQLSLRTVGPSGPFTLIGHSMGALLAARYTVTFPHMVERLILFNPPLLKDSNEATRTYKTTNVIYRLGLTAGLHRIVWPAYRVAAYTNMLNSTAQEQTRPFDDYLFKHTAASRYRSFRRIIIQNTILADLSQTAIPTLLVNGNQDRPIYQRNAIALDHTGNITVTTVSGDHHVPLRQPGKTVGLITDFTLPAVSFRK